MFVALLGKEMDCATASTTIIDVGLMEGTAAQERTRLACNATGIGVNAMKRESQNV